ncbi:Phycobilisome Linker polypeptide [Hyella patelloides LEGE 07179]|uniref:Phycobilisome Linker polypeptide n=1 Tax=Hyella patelloides LEGE 07179 TaxID=945734 RepID=A0A563W0L3_9CYAN|nr:phycobilisome rod-core linker polypeptide [Hyella patelloides]VEP17216.1 Phycobilisome Linker polypeptide [Hyella patelloides LEGE 07179]
MAIPLLEYDLSSQNQRVVGYELGGDEKPVVYRTDRRLSDLEKNQIIWATYRQIFNEQQILVSNRQTSLESQLKAGQITARELIRGLILSESFRRRNYEPNSNYRFVQMCVQRVLGRNIYGEKEKLAWSIVLATQGIEGFIDNLLDSEEYLDNFGENTVPYQRRRILPQREQGELPFARMPRYGADYRSKLEEIGYFSPKRIDTLWDGTFYFPPQPVLLAAKIATIAGASILTLGIVATALSAFGLISL